MAKKLKDIDSNQLGNHLEDYCDQGLNKKLRKFLALDDEGNIENILDKANFEEVTNEDIEVGIAVAEATLVEVNRVLKAQGIDFEFRRFSMIEYDAYMFVNTKDKLKATAQRVRDFRLKDKVRVVDTSPF
jgi:hypothetical protein